MVDEKKLMQKPGSSKEILMNLLLLQVLLFLTMVTTSSAEAKNSFEARNKNYLTVCGDPNHLPFSNKQMEGFENRIAQLIADDLGRTLRYQWWPQTIGFVRNTLKVRLCDLVMGVTSVNELLQNTNPYYRSVYTLVYRKERDLQIYSLDDPKLKDLKLGVVAGTPPATLLSKYGLLDQVHPYNRTVDTRLFSPATQAIDDVANGTIDLAVIWGPIAGYAAKKQTISLSVIPLPAVVDSVPLAFNVSMGIRRRENNWKHQLNEELKTLKPDIQRILLDYDIPLLDSDNKLIAP